MKVLLLIMCFSLVSSSYAVEVETECSAMNQNREKIVREVKTSLPGQSGSTAIKQ